MPGDAIEFGGLYADPFRRDVAGKLESARVGNGEVQWLRQRRKRLNDLLLVEDRCRRTDTTN